MSAKNRDIYHSVGLTPDMNSTADSISRLSIEATNGVCVSPWSDNFNSRSITSPPHTSRDTPTHDTRDTSHSTGDSSRNDSVDTNGMSVSPEQTEELCDRIRRQIEYYFSKENYWNDQYLLSQSDADQYVCLTTLATFPAVKNLTPDIGAIRLALRSSAQLEMDPTETKVRPNLKRCILILRDIPEDTSREEVEALFDGEGLPEVKGRVEYAINSNWYVRFDSESDAYTAYQFLISKTFNGRPIHPRIKSASSSVPSNAPELPAQYSPRAQFDHFSVYNYPTIPLSYMPPPVSSWAPMEPIMYSAGYLKPTLLVHRIVPMPRIIPPKSDYPLASLPRNGSADYPQSSPASSRHHAPLPADTQREREQGGGDRGPRRRTGSRYPLREEKRPERIPTPKMDADSFPPLPTSPGNNAVPSPQTPVEPTNKTLSDIVRKGQVGVSSPQQRHTAANPPPGIGRGRGRVVPPEAPLPEPGERQKEQEPEPNQKSTDATRPMGRGRKPKSLSTSDSPPQQQSADQCRSRSESGDKEILKSEKLSYAQMAQRPPPPPPPPLPEAATCLPPSPPLSDPPTPPCHSSQQLGFFKDTNDSISNGCVGRGSYVSQDSDNKYPHRKPFVRVSNGPMNRTVRGYNGSDNSKLRKGVYSSSRSSRERRHIPQDRDSAFKDH